MKYFLAITGVTIILLLVLWFLPLPSAFYGSALSPSIEDRFGSVLSAPRYDDEILGINHQSIPQTIVDALVVAEDRTFFSNPGVSARGLLRALIHDLQARRFREGGSTITQQLVRLTLAPEHRGLLYKCREMWLALKIGTRWSKQRVLERFLANAYFGQRAYGIESASITYFDKSPSMLSLSESALLVGLINAPSALNPFRNPDGALKRRDLVLRAMMETSTISEKEYTEAIQEPIHFVHGVTAKRAHHFIEWIKQTRVSELQGVSSVRTTLDLRLQTKAEEIINYQLEKLKDKNVTSAAVVVLDAQNGDVLTMVGSRDFYDDEHDGQVNLALAERQPGSALKPFTYALAFERGMTPATTISDTETQFFTQVGNPYIPRNYDYEYHGLVRLREALANSYNIVAVKLLERIGVPTLLAFLKSIGITTLQESPEHYGLALTLGSGEVTLLELTRAYAILARGGVTLRERSLLSDTVSEGTSALSPESAWLITHILSDPDARLAEFGSSGPLSFDFPVAAKTGTTRNSRDNWTIGYTPTRVVGVWVGNADNAPMKGTSGVTGAGPIFHDVMIEAMKGQEIGQFPRPHGITEKRICKLSGKRPTPLCHDTIIEFFKSGTEPRDPDDMYRELPIDSRTNLLASETCDKAYIQKKPFVVFPPELKAWAREKGWAVPPDSFSPLCSYQKAVDQIQKSIHIVSPAPETSFLLDPLIPNDQERIILEAIAPEQVRVGDWYIDRQKLQTAEQPLFRSSWIPTIGRHTIRFVTDAGEDTVSIDVVVHDQ